LTDRQKTTEKPTLCEIKRVSRPKKSLHFLVNNPTKNLHI